MVYNKQKDKNSVINAEKQFIFERRGRTGNKNALFSYCPSL